MADQDPAIKPTGLRKGQTSYGNTGFALFLRKSSSKRARTIDNAVAHTLITLATTGSGSNPWQRCPAHRCLSNAASASKARWLSTFVPYPSGRLLPTDHHIPAQSNETTEKMIRVQPCLSEPASYWLRMQTSRQLSP